MKEYPPEMERAFRLLARFRPPETGMFDDYRDPGTAAPLCLREVP